jgi:zinc protease
MRIGFAAAAAFVALAAPAAAQVTAWPSERPPGPLVARDVKFPPYEIRTLPNGLQVIAVVHHEQPAVSLRLIIRAGGAQDPAGRSGVASVAASLLDQGTTTKTAEQIAQTIDSNGGAIGAGAGTDLTFINAAFMKDGFGLALDLVADLARNPAFAPEEIERQRQQIVSGLKVSYDDPEYVAGMVFDRLVYGFHPYGRPNSGTPASISAITRDDLLAYHRKWFGANNAILAIVGDVTPEEAFAGAQRAFGGWGRVDLSAVKPADPPPAPARRVVIIDRPGSAQTEIRVGNLGLPRKSADYLALDIAGKILGGEGGNRLHRVLRAERGLTYGASADVNALKESGDVVANTDCRSEVTAEALRLIVDEMAKLQKQRVRQSELDDAQAYLTGSFPLTIETPSAIALQVLNAVFYGLDLNDLQTYRERVTAVGVDDIQRVAQQYLHPDRLAIVLVGDASVFAKQLPAVGFDQVERIPLAELDLSSADLRRHATPARLAPAGLRVAGERDTPQPDARELVARTIAAKGGLDLLRSIRTIRTESTTVVQTANGRAEAPSVTSIRYPAAYRMETRGADGELVQVFNAGEYWVKDARGVRQAPEAMAQQVRGTVQRDTIPLLLALADGRVAAKRMPDEQQDGRAMHVLEVALSGGRPLRLLIDPVTSLPAAARYTVFMPPDDVAVEDVYSDYRDVRGLKVPFRTIVRRAGETAIERVVRSFDYNVPLDAALFTKPL